MVSCSMSLASPSTQKGQAYFLYFLSTVYVSLHFNIPEHHPRYFMSFSSSSKVEGSLQQGS